MEGFLQIRLRPWLRRLLTRMVAIIPAAIIAGASGLFFACAMYDTLLRILKEEP